MHRKPSNNNKWSNQRMDCKTKMSLHSVLKDVEESSTKKHFKSTPKPVNWCSCPKENSLTQRLKDLLRKSR
jgi:hypothetical protein